MLLQRVRLDTERRINAFVNTVFAALVGVCFLIWYALTRHWLLVPVFFIGVLVRLGLTFPEIRRLQARTTPCAASRPIARRSRS